MFSVFFLFRSFYSSRIRFSILDTNIKNISETIPSRSKRQFYYLSVIFITIFINCTTWYNHSFLSQLLTLPPITILITSSEVFNSFYQNTKNKAYHHIQYGCCVIIAKFINMVIKNEITIERQVYPYEILQTFEKVSTLNLYNILSKILKAILYDYVNYLLHIITKGKVVDLERFKNDLIKMISTGNYEKLLSSYTINRLITIYKHSGKNTTMYEKLSKIFQKFQIQLLFINGYWGIVLICKHYWNMFSGCLICFLFLPYINRNYANNEEKEKILVIRKLYNIVLDIRNSKNVEKLILFKNNYSLLLDFCLFYYTSILTDHVLLQIIFYLYVNLLPNYFSDYNLIYKNIKNWIEKNMLVLLLLYFWHSLFSTFSILHLLVVTIEYYLFLLWKNYKVTYMYLTQDNILIEEKYFAR